MSLVSDALRKARQNELRRGMPVLPAVIPAPRRSRLGQGIVLGALIALAAAAVGAGVVWWLAGPSADRAAPAPPTRAAGGGAPPAASAGRSAEKTAAPATAAAAVRPQPPSSAGAGEPIGRPEPHSPAPTTAEPSALDSGAGTTSVEAHATARPPAPSAEQAGADGAPHERVYVLNADLGYAKLHLDYLVYSPSAPFGRINGQEIIVGSVVDGFIVEEIGKDYVKLRDRRGPLVLRTH